MADVVQFRPPEPKEADGEGPHLEGQAFCGACHNEWLAVVPVGTTSLQCPNCKRMWGALKHSIVPEVAWTCKCGEDLFWLTPTGAMCRRCGLRSNQWAE